MSVQKGMALTRQEAMQLVELVAKNPVVYSKATNAGNNKLKEAAWIKITESFNSKICSCPRTPEQLRLKWENLKKAARKRSSKIKMTELKTGGGKADYIPPDEALDKVAAILGATCEEDSVPDEGDTVKDVEITSCKSKAKLKSQTLTNEVMKSIIKRNNALAEYYESKKRNEQEIYNLKKRKLELSLMKQDNELTDIN